MAPSTLSPASSYLDQQRYNISSGKLFKFHEPPVPSYHISTTSSSIGVKGTLLELQPQKTQDDGEVCWDTYAQQPIYAARYHNPLVKKERRDVYWEVDVTSDDATGLCMGFVVKDDVKLQAMRDTNANGVDPRLHSDARDTISVGPSILINASNGVISIDGNTVPTMSPMPSIVDIKTVGMGISFAYTTTPPKNEQKEEKKENVFKKFIDKHTTPPTPSATPEDLKPVPVAVFVTVNNEMVSLDVSGLHMVKLGFDGTRDIYPAILVRGGDVSATLKMGECVSWNGAGGAEDAKVAGLGNRAKDGFKQSRWPFRGDDSYGWWSMA